MLRFPCHQDYPVHLLGTDHGITSARAQTIEHDPRTKEAMSKDGTRPLVVMIEFMPYPTDLRYGSWFCSREHRDLS